MCGAFGSRLWRKGSSQDVETSPQLCSRIVQTLNIPHREGAAPAARGGPGENVYAPALHPPTQEATAVKLWRNVQRVSSEALAKEDTLRRIPPKTQQGPRLLSRGAPLAAALLDV